MRDGKALVFCADRWDIEEFEREHLKEMQAIISVLGLKKDAYELTAANCCVDSIIENPEIKVVFAYGWKPNVQEAATKAGKVMIVYEKEHDCFSSIKTEKVNFGGGVVMYNNTENPLIS